MKNENLESEIIDRLKSKGVEPLIGGLIPEKYTAELLGYSPSYFRRLSSGGGQVIPYILRGNRRLYRVGDIATFVAKTIQ